MEIDAQLVTRLFQDVTATCAVVIEDARPADWAGLLGHLRDVPAHLELLRGTEHAIWPDELALLFVDDEAPYRLAIRLGDLPLALAFRDPSRISLEFDPSDITDEMQARVLFRLMSTLGRRLETVVRLVLADLPEFPLALYSPGGEGFRVSTSPPA